MMVRSAAETVEAYVAELSPDRREAITAVREVILSHLPEGYEESMQFGMIGYVVPSGRYPITYNNAPLLYAALASQKNVMSLYLMCTYANAAEAERFVQAYKESGKRFDMGKSCVRFRKLDDLPLDLIGETIARTPVDEFIRHYEASRRPARA